MRIEYVPAETRAVVIHEAEHTLVERRELHGDEVVALLERHRLRRPEFDPADDEQWPRL